LLFLIGFFLFLGYKNHLFFLSFKVKVGFFTTIPSFFSLPLGLCFFFHIMECLIFVASFYPILTHLRTTLS
jgi:hypothetical protein